MRGPRDVAPYLWMLNLGADDGPKAQAFMRAALADGVDDAEALALLADTNWRPNIVVAFAVAIGLRSAPVIDALWATLDRGTWVSPQLAAAARIADDRFLARARERLVDPSRVDGKVAGALLALAREAAPDEPWIAERMADTTLAASIATAVDDGGAIATAWYRAVRSRG